MPPVHGRTGGAVEVEESGRKEGGGKAKEQ